MNVLSGSKKIVGTVYVLAMFIVAMDATVLNVALRTISEELGVPPAAAGTLNVGYLVSLAVFLPVAGWLGDRWGQNGSSCRRWHCLRYLLHCALQLINWRH